MSGCGRRRGAEARRAAPEGRGPPWNFDATGFFTGDIFDRAAIRLEGELRNEAERQDCEGGMCSISLETTLRTSSTVDVRRVSMNPDAFVGVEGAGQAAGAGDPGDDTGRDTDWDTGWDTGR